VTTRSRANELTRVLAGWPVRMVTALFVLAALQGAAAASTIDWVIDLRVDGTVGGFPPGGAGSLPRAASPRTTDELLRALSGR
jgi:hypothetical protein